MHQRVSVVYWVQIYALCLVTIPTQQPRQDIFQRHWSQKQDFRRRFLKYVYCPGYSFLPWKPDEKLAHFVGFFYKIFKIPIVSMLLQLKYIPIYIYIGSYPLVLLFLSQSLLKAIAVFSSSVLCVCVCVCLCVRCSQFGWKMKFDFFFSLRWRSFDCCCCYTRVYPNRYSMHACMHACMPTKEGGEGSWEFSILALPQVSNPVSQPASFVTILSLT